MHANTQAYCWQEDHFNEHLLQHTHLQTSLASTEISYNVFTNLNVQTATNHLL